MATSKLKSFEKLMINGEHSFWDNPKGGRLWKFTVEFENGDKGTTQKKDENGKGLEIGKEYIYEKVVTGNFTNIKGMKDPNSTFGGSGFKSSYNDPKSIERWLKANVVALTNKAGWIIPNYDKQLSGKKIMTWLNIPECKEDKDLAILRRTVLENVIDDCRESFDSSKPANLDEMLTVADKNWNYIYK